MPDETKFGSLESLVGRTFERDGEQRFISAVESRLITGYIVGTEEGFITNAPSLAPWLSGAKEVTQ